LHDAISFLLLAADDIGADGFGMTFDGFGGDLQAGQQLQLLATDPKTTLASHHCHHAPHSRGTLGTDHIHFLIARALSAVAMGTEIIGALKIHRSQHGQ